MARHAASKAKKSSTTANDAHASSNSNCIRRGRKEWCLGADSSGPPTISGWCSSGPWQASATASRGRLPGRARCLPPLGARRSHRE
jgi:hypothetical protein